MDSHERLQIEEALLIAPPPVEPREPWRRLFLNAYVALLLFVAAVVAAILLAPGASASGGCGGG